MKIKEILALHDSLWNHVPEVVFRGNTIKTVTRNKDTKKFTMVDLPGDYRAVTQNMGKRDSRWTQYVEHDRSRRVTWFFRNGSYVGRLQSWIDTGTLREHYQLYRLPGDELVFDEEFEVGS